LRSRWLWPGPCVPLRHAAGPASRLPPSRGFMRRRTGAVHLQFTSRLCAPIHAQAGRDAAVRPGSTWRVAESRVVAIQSDAIGGRVSLQVVRSRRSLCRRPT
jgi:hypothetical protein